MWSGVFLNLNLASSLALKKKIGGLVGVRSITGAEGIFTVLFI